MASAVSVTLEEGDVTSRTFQILSAGNPLNIASMTVTAFIKTSQRVEDNAVGVYALTVGSGIEIVDAATGKVRISVPSAVTDSPSAWYYKIKVTYNGETETAIHGWIQISDA